MKINVSKMRYSDFEEATLVFGRYSDGRTAIQLWTDEGPLATATVNVPEYDLPPSEVIIKDYSENEGVLQSLIDAGVVSEPHDYINLQFVKLPVCELLIGPEAAA